MIVMIFDQAELSAQHCAAAGRPICWQIVLAQGGPLLLVTRALEDTCLKQQGRLHPQSAWPMHVRHVLSRQVPVACAPGCIRWSGPKANWQPLMCNAQVSYALATQLC
jgi:hypothetical protein